MYYLALLISQNCNNKKLIKKIACTTELFIRNMKFYSRELFIPFNHLKKLDTTLRYKNTNISSEDIKCLINLEILDVSDNKNISDLNSLTNLKVLCANNTKISSENIKCLINLEKLVISSNKVIRNLNSLINLKVLIACRT